MNTPPLLKRHNPKIKFDHSRPDGHYSGSIGDPEIAAEVARLAAEFVHLEGHMASILGVLLGITDFAMPGYVLRAIKSPRGRVDLLKSLLQNAPSNKNLPDTFDAAIDEFWSINQRRNDYIHGEWWTHESGATFASFFDPHGNGLMAGREIKKEEITAVRDRIGKHIMVIVSICAEAWQKRLHPEPPAQTLPHE